jgi:hypothetical protein
MDVHKNARLTPRGQDCAASAERADAEGYQ